MNNKLRLIIELTVLLLVIAFLVKVNTSHADNIPNVTRTQSLEIVSADGAKVYAKVSKDGIDLLDEKGEIYATLTKVVNTFPTLTLSSSGNSTQLSTGSFAVGYTKDGKYQSDVVMSFRGEFGSLFAMSSERGLITLKARDQSITLKSSDGKSKTITPSSETTSP